MTLALEHSQVIWGYLKVLIAPQRDTKALNSIFVDNLFQSYSIKVAVPAEFSRFSLFLKVTAYLMPTI